MDAEFTVLVINIEAGPTIVGTIELVRPSNKARPAARRAFAMKCPNYLNDGIGLIIYAERITVARRVYHSATFWTMLSREFRVIMVQSRCSLGMSFGGPSSEKCGSEIHA
jgi:hypothetical protein